MRIALVVGIVIAAQPAAWRLDAALVGVEQGPRAQEHHISVGTVTLFARELGQGQPIIVLHGGPDFDHSYFLPDLDRLAAAYRLIYYDQRGRGKSADGVQPADVTLESEIADLEKVRQSFAPTLVIYGERDFIPPAAAVHIAEAIPNARLVGFESCGHFSYLDCPDAVRKEIDSLFRR